MTRHYDDKDLYIRELEKSVAKLERELAAATKPTRPSARILNVPRRKEARDD